MGDRRADHERPVVGADASELVDPLDVDQMPEGRKPELEQEQQLCAATDDRRVLAVALQELGGLLDRAGAVKIERRQRHGAPRPAGASAYSSRKKSPRAFLLRTRSTCSGSRPLSLTLAISTSGWWNGTSEPKRTRVSPTRSEASLIFVCIGMREVTREKQLDQWVHGRVVRVIAVEQRVQLHPEELRVVEEFLRLGQVAGQS